MYNTNHIPHIPVGVFILFRNILAVSLRLPETARRKTLGCWPVGSDVALSPWWCHLVTRAFAKHYPQVRVGDGLVRGHQHSWLITDDGHIIDLSPIGRCSSPQLFVKGQGFEEFSTEFVEGGGIDIENILSDPHFHRLVEILAADIEPFISKACDFINGCFDPTRPH